MKTSSPDDANILIQKLPCDMGIHRNPRKGTLNAPEKLLEDLEFDRKVLIDEVFPDEFDLEETQRRIEDNTEELVRHEKPILSIGGDHSVSFPVIKVLKRKYPDLKLVWLDSHLDLKEKVGNHVSHDVVVRELLENCNFSEEEIISVGTTEIDDDEREFLDGYDLRIYNAEELEEVTREFDFGEQPVYLSIDIDVLSPEIAHGTGYPDGKLELKQVLELIRRIEPQFADLVEVAPTLDSEYKTLQTGQTVLQELVDSTIIKE